MNLKVGDEVKIKRSLYSWILYDRDDMDRYIGKRAIITEIYSETIKLDIDNGDNDWFEEILEKILKLNLGDKIRIKKREDIKNHFGIPNDSLQKYCGKEAVVKSIQKNGVKLNIDGGEWYWNSDMLEEFTQVDMDIDNGFRKENVGLIEKIDCSKKNGIKEQIQEDNLFIIIDETTTICIPKDTPYGVSRKNKEGIYDELYGNSLSYIRYKENKEKGER